MTLGKAGAPLGFVCPSSAYRQLRLRAMTCNQNDSLESGFGMGLETDASDNHRTRAPSLPQGSKIPVSNSLRIKLEGEGCPLAGRKGSAG